MSKIIIKWRSENMNIIIVSAIFGGLYGAYYMIKNKEN